MEGQRDVFPRAIHKSLDESQHESLPSDFLGPIVHTFSYRQLVFRPCRVADRIRCLHHRSSHCSLARSIVGNRLGGGISGRRRYDTNVTTDVRRLAIFLWLIFVKPLTTWSNWVPLKSDAGTKDCRKPADLEALL